MQVSSDLHSFFASCIYAFRTKIWEGIIQRLLNRTANTDFILHVLPVGNLKSTFLERDTNLNHGIHARCNKSFIRSTIVCREIFYQKIWIQRVEIAVGIGLYRIGSSSGQTFVRSTHQFFESNFLPSIRIKSRESDRTEFDHRFLFVLLGSVR